MRLGTLAAALALLASSCASTAPAPEPARASRQLTIYFTGDALGELEPCG